MNTLSEPDELRLAQTENRHLKDTIAALRQELERLQIENDENLQKAASAANDEIGQLKATVIALRDEMKKMEIYTQVYISYILGNGLF